MRRQSGESDRAMQKHKCRVKTRFRMKEMIQTDKLNEQTLLERRLANSILGDAHGLLVLFHERKHLFAERNRSEKIHETQSKLQSMTAGCC
jgi:hypothetical protein